MLRPPPLLPAARAPAPAPGAVECPTRTTVAGHRHRRCSGKVLCSYLLVVLVLVVDAVVGVGVLEE